MHFRLRYQQHDLELAEGEFAIGRSAACQLSLDDPLVSRRHAVFKVKRGQVSIEDCGSRNGVLVNGQRIEGEVVVQPGDKVLIGSQEMTVIRFADAERVNQPTHPTASRFRATLNRFELDAVTDEYTMTKAGYVPPGNLIEEATSVKRIDGFKVLGSVAEKALAMGRADEAERVLATSLSDVMDACRRGQPVAPALAEQATRFAAKLASVTGKGSWVDYVIEVYTAQARPAPAVVIDELYGAFRKVSAVDVTKVKAYVETLRAQLPTFGPADRFLFQRIEGLERLATLRG